MTRVLNGVVEDKINKPCTVQWTLRHRRRSVDQSDVTILTNQRTLLDNGRRGIQADISQDVCIGHSQLPRPIVDA